MKVLSIVNQKGGTGKTTTADTLAAYFAARGKRVLGVDYDVQGHMGVCLGKGKGNGLAKWLVDDLPLCAVVIEARHNLDLVLSDKRTERIKTFMGDMLSRELYIAQKLEEADGHYDLVLLDLAPGSDILHVGSLVASDWFLVPAKMDYLSLDGVVEVLQTVRSLARIPHVDPPKLVGALPTMYDRTTTETAANVKRLGDMVGAAMVLPPIPMDTRIREATSRGMTIWEYAPESAAAVGYANGGRPGDRGCNSRGNLGGYLHMAEILEAVLF